MTVESSGSDGEDRVVSRRVDNPTEAGPDDEQVYRAANPVPDGAVPGTDSAGAGTPGDGGAAERAEREMQGSAESEPTRSE